MSELNNKPLDLPNDIPTLHNIIKTTLSKLLSTNQMAQELMKVNIDLRAHLYMLQTTNSQMEEYIKNLMAPPKVEEKSESQENVVANEVSEKEQASELQEDANTISA